MKEFMSDPIRQRAYQAFGDLLIETPGVGEPTDYALARSGHRHRHHRVHRRRRHLPPRSLRQLSGQRHRGPPHGSKPSASRLSHSAHASKSRADAELPWRAVR